MIIGHRTPDRLSALLAVPLLALALGACASTDPTPERSSETGAGSSTSDPMQWAFDFAECMRGHGIDMEDPSANGGTVASAPQDETPERQAAEAACVEELGPSPVRAQSPGGDAGDEQHEQLLALAACLREHGFDVADPEPGTGLGMPADVTEEAIDACGTHAPDSVPAE
ncbi:hypothetical protein [Cellulomonas cellasea]|uniref:Secreted protein n=2 Tax=Cellulomonas cellasea TaxID=43670 RepID=A0A0A0B3Z9_9CELL|nr:hypothetical protein [Cellulomonas cellasea]KGM00907.1 hypothetical protein Q760_05335 [Cellulomonas cellasea DSM 20118]GEA87206.1 hypothetical protein CCE01nite_11550 [Cellulomonas cellasea]